MEPEAFVAEVYRRMSERHGTDRRERPWDEVRRDPVVRRTVDAYRPLLPADRDAPILDVGFGAGWFLAACVELGYTNVSGAEFGGRKQHFKSWSPAIREIYAIDTSIGDFLADRPESFAFIHLSHVIEHIPKHHLLYVVDALYRALEKGGTLFVRTPNMEGPCATSALFVTLGHEYGFCGSNLASLLEICNFDDLRFHDLTPAGGSLRRRLGAWARRPIVGWNALRHRLFGANQGDRFGAELIASARRGDRPPLFDPKYR